MYFSMDIIAKAAQQIGIRGFIGYGMIDLNNEEKREKEIKLKDAVQIQLLQAGLSVPLVEALYRLR